MPCCSISTRAPAFAAGLVLVTTAAAALTAALAAEPESSAPADTNSAAMPNDPAMVLVHTMDSIEGEAIDLARYRGRVLMLVNVASRCGLTPQYAQLQELYETYHEAGFEILAFPANDFGNQEPGSNREIAEFCDTRFGVSFPMFSKITVTGEEAHPLYRQLAALSEPLGGQPRWNFTKFLVDRTGRVVARFEPRTRPDAPEVVERIEALLAE